MIHILNKSYLERIELYVGYKAQQEEKVLIVNSAKGEIHYDSGSLEELVDNFFNGAFQVFFDYLANSNEKLIIYCLEEDYLEIVTTLWANLLEDSSQENLYSLYNLHLKDVRLKSSAESHTHEQLALIRSFRPPSVDVFNDQYGFCVEENIDLTQYLEGVGFEYLLASYFTDQKYNRLFFDRIEYLSWRQIIQEFFVIRNQMINGLYNNINLVLPKGYEIDYDEDIEAQILTNKYLSWMYDLDFHEDNAAYVKDNYDINIFSELYDNWIKYRRPKERSEGEEVELDNLIWITQAIKDENWELLLKQNIERDFGCIYVDNWLIHKANQVITGMMYRDYNHRKTNETALSFKLK